MPSNKVKREECKHCMGTGEIHRINPDWLRERRVEAGISLREVSRKLKFSAAFISDIELGRRNASIEIISFYEALPSPKITRAKKKK